MPDFDTGMFPDPGTEIEGVFTEHTPDNVVAGHIVERVRKGLAEASAVVGLTGPVFLGDVNGRDDPLDSPVFLPGRLAAQGRPSSRTAESLRG